MKKILLPCFLICAAAGTKAQTAPVLVTDTTQLMQQQLLLLNRVISKKNNATVYALPQDGMPCLVPDSSAWTLMPNIKPDNVTTGVIPNPYKPKAFPKTLILPPAKTSTQKEK